MYTVLDKDTIELEIIPYIPLTKRGFPPTVPLVEIVNAILYKLKTGVQWHQLPTQVFFKEKPLSWEAVYYHYRKWCVNAVSYTHLRAHETDSYLVCRLLL